MGVVLSLFVNILRALLGKNQQVTTHSPYTPDANKNNNNNANFVEGVVAKVSEIQNGEVKECSLGEGKILLVKDKAGQLSAVGSKCTHYSAPLKSGAFCDGRIRCPWHGAAFDGKTGDIEDFPGMDSLPCFDVKVVGEDIIVSGDANEVKTSKRTKKMVKRDASDKRTALIVGGGPAGTTCAETLRQNGFTGRIVMSCKESWLPYDRPKLSKAMSIKPDKIYLRQADFFKNYDIEVLLGNEVVEFNGENKNAKLKDGQIIDFDMALLATGGFARTLPVPGSDALNIFVLRDAEDANKVLDATNSKHVVIVGSSFIGMETASCIVKQCKSVTVLGMEKTPFERVLGVQVGAALRKFHEKNGIQFKMEAVAKEFIVKNNLVCEVILNNGEQIPADVVVLGAGIIPSTGYIKNGVKFNPRDKSVMCDVNMKAGEGIWAAGDMATFPFFGLDNKEVRIEHWGMAQYHGMVAGLNMVGKTTPARSVPFFWTTIFGKSIRYAGYALEYDDVIIDKPENGFEPDTLNFVAYYAKGERIYAVCSMNRDPVCAQAAELMNIGKMPTASEVKAALAKGNSEAALQAKLN